MRICGVCGRVFPEAEGLGRYCSLHCQLADVDDFDLFCEEEVEYEEGCEED